jgi:hypothetical protein
MGGQEFRRIQGEGVGVDGALGGKDTRFKEVCTNGVPCLQLLC